VHSRINFLRLCKNWSGQWGAPQPPESATVHHNVNPVNFVKNRARDPPLRGNYNGKIPNFKSLWGREPTPINQSR